MALTFLDRDLGVMFAGPGCVPVRFGTQPATTGLLDVQSALQLEVPGFSGVEGDQWVLRLPYFAFSPMPSQRDGLTADGKAWTVQDKRLDGDGKVVYLMLKAQ